MGNQDFELYSEPKRKPVAQLRRGQQQVLWLQKGYTLLISMWISNMPPI